MFFIFPVCPDTYNSIKESTLLDKLYFFSVLASCTVISLFNELVVARFSNGAAKVRIFFKPASVSEKIFKFFFGSRSGESNATVLSRTHSHPFLKWECKGTTFFHTSKSFSAHRENGQRRNHVPDDPMCWAPGTYAIVTILLK